MKNSNQKRYNKVKRTSIWGSIIACIVFTGISAAVVNLAVNTFTRYMLESKLGSEYEIVSYMADLYQMSTSDNKEDEETVDFIYSVLDEEGMNYIIRKESGELIHVTGENTCSDEGGIVETTTINGDISILMDSENSMLKIKNGRLNISYDEFLKNSGAGIENIIVDDNADVDFVELPVWIVIDVKEGTEQFIGRAEFSANANDVMLLGEIMLIIIALVGTVIIAMMINALVSVIRQRRVVNAFFADDVTTGHNWAWFVVKGGKRLKSSAGAKNKYAVVHLTFINYRNYCLCHSLREGEKMLQKVYECINSHITRKEMCAHVTSSSFALLLKYEGGEEELRGRVRDLIADLEKIETGHKFSFQAGISYVNQTRDKNGNPIKRKDISIENEYNSACTARATLDGSDESGVAIFDEKLVEDEIWLDKVQEKQEQAVRNEEFVVYYQPKYDPRTNELRGAEALIRWDSPDFGFVTPYKFIPIFENNGFITEIDHYMIRHVARDQRRWLNEGRKCVPVSVNVSRAHFAENDLADQICEMIDAEGTPHELIEIELTESAFFDDKKAMVDTINKLKKYGFAVSMDDFGSGYSSLNSLKDMPLDVLKLDAGFFRGKTEDGRGKIVVSEAIRLAKSLNMRTVAEGVEEKNQVDFLASEGCDMIQGYYYAKPMPGDEYEERMSKAEQ